VTFATRFAMPADMVVLRDLFSQIVAVQRRRPDEPAAPSHLIRGEGTGRPRRQQPTTNDGTGRCLVLIDGLIALHGGARGVTEDRNGPGKTVYVKISLPAIARCPNPVLNLPTVRDTVEAGRHGMNNDLEIPSRRDRGCGGSHQRLRPRLLGRGNPDPAAAATGSSSGSRSAAGIAYPVFSPYRQGGIATWVEDERHEQGPRD
jgi:hypothetical protein